MSTLGFAEYIWLDGSQPTQRIRSKARIVDVPQHCAPADFPEWSFDGSSTEQATGENSDCLLKPIRVARDPAQGVGNYLVLCEVLNPDGTPHLSNQRARLRHVLSAIDPTEAPWVGFEQEYTIYQDGRPLGFPANGFPGPQGPYYCSVGTDRAYGRDVAVAHASACMGANLMLYGTNAEVMPGQWEFQVGYRGIEGETGDALEMADHLWIARYLLHRVGESFDATISFENKPVPGDWNGAGMHTNFSTAATRDPNRGADAIQQAVSKLENGHEFHIAHYGDRLHERLTGLHETCDIDTFKSGVAHRGASIRIPHPVALKGYGYLEDRRPGANADPYLVAACLVATVCDAEQTFRNFDQPSTAAAA
ncbi:MAG: glutamine synthetase [Alphaproteobacteria bacterium]|nr:glutamine synthetase [Alphaproteobacteria bacterium]